MDWEQALIAICSGPERPQIDLYMQQVEPRSVLSIFTHCEKQGSSLWVS
jgi:hypothetical protein